MIPEQATPLQMDVLPSRGLDDHTRSRGQKVHGMDSNDPVTTAMSCTSLPWPKGSLPFFVLRSLQ